MTYANFNLRIEAGQDDKEENSCAQYNIYCGDGILILRFAAAACVSALLSFSADCVKASAAHPADGSSWHLLFGVYHT